MVLIRFFVLLQNPIGVKHSSICHLFNIRARFWSLQRKSNFINFNASDFIILMSKLFLPSRFQRIYQMHISQTLATCLYLHRSHQCQANMINIVIFTGASYKDVTDEGFQPKILIFHFPPDTARPTELLQ